MRTNCPAWRPKALVDTLDNTLAETEMQTLG